MKIDCQYLGNKSYGDSYRLQKEAVARRIHGEINDTLYLLEHHHCITIGKMGSRKNLLISDEEAVRRGIEVYETDRGGDITYHGPGQLVGYPIIQLQTRRKDVKWYLEMLEQTIIMTLSEFGIQGKRIDGLTGVWVEDRKIASIGVRVEKWITSHGFALNVNTDLSYFKLIVPCGIKDKDVTSMEKELSLQIDLQEIVKVYIQSFSRIFGCES